MKTSSLKAFMSVTATHNHCICGPHPLCFCETRQSWPVTGLGVLSFVFEGLKEVKDTLAEKRESSLHLLVTCIYLSWA